MSYILEAIKKAESERGNDRLHENVLIDNDDVKVKRRIPWVAMAIFFNAAILLLWIAMQLLSSPDGEVANNESEANVVPNQLSAPEQIQASNGIEDDDDLNQLTQDFEFPSVEQRNTNTLIDEADNSSVPVIVTENNKVKNTEPEINEVTPASREANFFKTKNNKTPQAEIVADDKLLDEASAQLEFETQFDVQPESDNLAIAKVDPLPFTPDTSLDANNQTLQQEPEPVVVEEVELPKEIAVIRHSDTPSIEELPYAIQQKLPKLVISVHVYNIDKSARKVRVNGQLLYEGDQLDNDVIVEEITSYGVIFDYSGTLFRKNLR